MTIEKGTGGARRSVTVTYEVCFTSCEVTAGATFVEKVTIRGDDPIWDDNLTTLVNHCVRATNDCVSRRILRSVSRSTLDEDGDTVVFGVPIFADRDELYARVTLTPLELHSASGDSNIVTGQFGAAGHD